MEVQSESDRINIHIKQEKEEIPASSNPDLNQFSGVQTEECHQDYNCSDQSTSVEPGLLCPEIKIEDDSYCWIRSDVSLLAKEECDLGIYFGDNRKGVQKLFFCHHCSQSRATLKQLKYHIGKRHKFLSVHCKKYTTSGSAQQYRKQEIKPALREKTYFHCPFCGYITKTSANLRRHIVTHFKEQIYVPIEKEPPYQCPFCQFNTSYPQNLNLHIINLHMEHYQCTNCEYSTTTFKCLKLHIRSVHKKEKPHQCTHCNYAATQSSALKTHIRSVHTKERPHQCPHCNYGATQSSTLTTHIMAQHTKEKPHRCPHCEYAATGSGNLKSHIMSAHTKEKPYQCSHCGYATTYSTSLKTHIMSYHTKEKPHQCPHCEYAATQYGTLKTHIVYSRKGKTSSLSAM